MLRQNIPFFSVSDQFTSKSATKVVGGIFVGCCLNSETLAVLRFAPRSMDRVRFLSGAAGDPPSSAAGCFLPLKIGSEICMGAESPCILVVILQRINALDRRARKVIVVRCFEVH